MKKLSFIEKVDKANLCLGCGLCESICGEDNVKMTLGADGFFHPIIINPAFLKTENTIERVCPSINVVLDKPISKGAELWGEIINLYSGYSKDAIVRKSGSSGGMVSGIAINLLERGIVDGILHVGGDIDDFYRNTLKISYTKEDVLNCASSRYAPASVFNNIINILDENPKMVFGFIGKPCDISGMKNLLKEFPTYNERIKITIAIICAGIPSFNGTDKIINDLGAERPVKNLVYRGDGWPGYFSFTDKNMIHYKKTYNESWGKTLNRHLNLRCKVCPDGIGLQADIAIGDAWETKDGYPNFDEKEGNSLIIIRTLLGENILNDIVKSDHVALKSLSLDKIRIMQPYQYNRRERVTARLAALRLVKGVRLNFVNTSIYKNSSKVGFLSLIKEFLRTYKRLIKM